MKPILCSNCFQPLKVDEYDIGFFIYPCDDCESGRIERLKDEAYDQGYEDGFETSRDEIKIAINKVTTILEEL